jgi:hypothetical protein
MTLSQVMTKVSLGVAVAATLAVTVPSASYAFGDQDHYYSSNSEDPGSVWSNYRGYFSNENDPTVRATRPHAQVRANRSPRGVATEPTHAPERPACMVGPDGGCR